MLINKWLFQGRIHKARIHDWSFKYRIHDVLRDDDDICKCRVWEYTTLFNWLKHETMMLNVP